MSGRATSSGPPVPDDDGWGSVAAPGTDPERLAAVVARAVGDRRGLASAWRESRRAGSPPGRALDDVLARPTLVADVVPHRRAWRRLGVRVALAGDPGMPDRLVRHDVVPPWWASLGSDPADRPAVAIVGSRSATGYGRGVAAWLAEAAADAGVHVVSGGAVGIDGAAHGSSLDRPGGTTVVLGCGHDVPYPRPHAGPDGLFDRVRRAGGRIGSESLPQDQPVPHAVRSRNRLIAALADAVVVVEGRERSGSLITASWAADLGLPVLAVPGDVRAPGSAAPHQLLRDGAAVCTGPEDLVAAVAAGVVVPDDARQPTLAAGGLDPWLQAPLAAAWPRSMSLARVVAASGRGTHEVLAAVTRGQVAGLLTRDLDGIRLRRRPADPA